MEILSNKEVTMLWFDNCYDGPLSGVCKYLSHLYYFDTVEFGGWMDPNEVPEGHTIYPDSLSFEDHEHYPNGIVSVNRRYALYKLTYSEYKLEQAWQIAFQTMVGKRGLGNKIHSAYYRIRESMKVRNYNEREVTAYWE